MYPTIRDLVMSYFEHYYNWDGERSLRAYSRPVSLARFDRIGWMTAEHDLWEINDHLVRLAHARLLPRGTSPRLARLDRRTFEAGLYGAPGPAHRYPRGH